MGYKKMNKSISFADLALASSLGHNRSLRNMERMDKAIDWSGVETISLSYYTFGTSSEGADGKNLISLLFNVNKITKRYIS